MQLARDSCYRGMKLWAPEAVRASQRSWADAGENSDRESCLLSLTDTFAGGLFSLLFLTTLGSTSCHLLISISPKHCKPSLLEGETEAQRGSAFPKAHEVVRTPPLAWTCGLENPEPAKAGSCPGLPAG